MCSLFSGGKSKVVVLGLLVCQEEVQGGDGKVGAHSPIVAGPFVVVSALLKYMTLCLVV
jgi:hypothetical protein